MQLGVVFALVVSVLLDQIVVSLLVRLPSEIALRCQCLYVLFMARPWPDYKPGGQKSEPYEAS